MFYDIDNSKDYSRLVNKGLIKLGSKLDQNELYNLLDHGKRIDDQFHYMQITYELNGEFYFLTRGAFDYVIYQYLCDKYNAHNKSPYSLSSYTNPNKKWNGDIDGGIRISNHWNFQSEGVHHCSTSNHVENNTYYSVGIYDSTNKTYRIIESIRVF